MCVQCNIIFVQAQTAEAPAGRRGGMPLGGAAFASDIRPHPAVAAK
jgi:hypothetical protein